MAVLSVDLEMLTKGKRVRYFVYIVFVFLVFGCASKPNIKPEKKIVIKDINITKKTPTIQVEKKLKPKKKVIDFKNQESAGYIENAHIKAHLFSQTAFETSYFSAWNLENGESVWNDVDWAFQSYWEKKTYGQNLKPLENSFFYKAFYNANFPAYDSIHQKAITLHSLDIRAFPTEKPLFLNPKQAGEGFPFDYLQNSRIHANKPLFITHYSKDKKWAHVISSFTFGWVQVKDIAYLSDKQVTYLQQAKQVFLTRDNVALNSIKGEYLFDSKLGMLLPLIQEKKDSLIVLAIETFQKNKPRFVKVEISKSIAHIGNIEFNSENLKQVLDDIKKSKYGWGGLYGERDCSSTLRDLFAPFGMWLPRNSSRQSRVGEIVSLDNLNKKEKLKKIKSLGVPFRTLLYKKGHIVLYVGVNKGEVIILQNVWGVKTKKEGKEGRYIVGKVVFSTLELGKELENYDADASLLKKLKSMNTF